jgi:hypothetical protein
VAVWGKSKSLTTEDTEEKGFGNFCALGGVQ